MPISFGQIQVPEGGFRIYINNVDYSNHALNYNFKEVDNEVKDFWVDLIGVSFAQRTADVLSNKVVRVESNGQLIFKGITERPDYKTGERITIRGIGSLESKLRRVLADVTASSSVDSPVLRPIYENQSIKDITAEQIATVSDVTVDSVDDGTELGSGSFRGDHVNVLSMVVNPTIQKGGKWWSTHGTSSPWSDDIYHTSASRGSESSVITFNTSGNDANANLTENEQDFESLANWVEILGYGDGINQLRSVNFHATTTRSFLASDVDDSQDTIDLVDASDFSASGTAWIGMEKISYTGKSTNTLTGITRGGDNVILNDDFTDGDYTNDPTWTVQSGTWTAASNALATTTFQSGTRITVPLEISENNAYSWEFTFTREGTNSNSWVALMIPGVSSNDGYFMVYSSGVPSGSIFLRKGGYAGTNVISGGALDMSTSHAIKVTKNNSGLWTLFVDGSAVGTSATDTTYTSGTHLAIGSNGSGKPRIDNLVVTNIFDFPTYAHSSGIEVYDAQYTTASPQSGSSIHSDENGLSQKSFQEKSVFDQDTLDRIAQKVSADRKDLVTRLIVVPSDPYDAARIANIDDTITVIDADSDTDGDFKVVLKELNSEDGLEKLVFHCSNKRLTESDELEENRKISELESRFSQGATNIFVVNETENAVSGVTPPGPIDIFFEIPVEAVGLNQVKFSYRNEKPRTWSQTVTSSSAGGSSIIVASQQSSVLKTMTTSYQDLTNVIFGSGDHTSDVIVYVSLNMFDNDVYEFRLSDGTNFFPSSTGVDVSATLTDNGDSSDQAIVLHAPIDAAGLTITLQGKIDTGSNDGGNSAILAHFTGIGLHDHDISSSDLYGIVEQTYTTSDIRIYTTNDADGTPTWTERTAAIETALGRALNSGDEEVETNLNLTAFFSGTGFRGVRIVTNGNSRHKAQVLGKVFIESKTVS